MSNEEVTGRLENWYLHGYVLLVGDIYDDIRGRFEDGQSIHTSAIKDNGDNIKEGDVVQTRNSRYLLGNRWCPSMGDNYA